MSAVDTSIFEIRASPHLHSERSVETIMRAVVMALLPLCAYSVWTFGLSALALIVVTTAACLAFDRDYSAAITGILLALTLPPGFPLWMAAIGGLIAIGPAKLLFGGLGFNLFNPALVARAFLQAAFPVAITTYTPAAAAGRFSHFLSSTLAWPFLKPHYDSITGATPLMLQKFDHVTTAIRPLFFGERMGSAGETSALLILLCGGYLIARKIMNWRIPVAMLGSAFLSGLLFHLSDAARYPSPFFVLFSGGLMLGAMFMATDPVGAPVTPIGVWIYGGIIGLITVLIRFLGGLPEGVMYAILLGNAMSPWIDNITQPRVYGVKR